MTKALDLLESMAGAALAQENLPSPQRIREIIGAVRKIPDCSSVSDDAAEALAKEFEARHGVTMTIGAVLIEQGYEPWLEASRVNISPYYWIS